MFFSERVYAPIALGGSDFVVIVGGVAYPVSDINNLSGTLSGADMKITLTHPPVSEGIPVLLRYTGRVGSITDQAGNELVSNVGEEHTISNIPFVTLSLDPQDDTGVYDTDGVTQFNHDNAVVISASLTSGVFSESDRVEIYRDNAGVKTLLKNIVISSGRGFRSVNAHGRSNFTISLEKNSFVEGDNTLFAVHVPLGDISSGNSGPEYVITYDVTEPVIEVTDPDISPARSKVVRANDNEDAETSWVSKVIDGAETCSEKIMQSDTALYTEGEDLESFVSEDDNGSKACFAVTDLAGNTSYSASVVIEGIDTESPVVSSASVTNVTRTRTKVVFDEPIYASSPLSVLLTSRFWRIMCRIRLPPLRTCRLLLRLQETH